MKKFSALHTSISSLNDAADMIINFNGFNFRISLFDAPRDNNVFLKLKWLCS
ncbi:hypothetical protein HanRHA438_Chr03g0127971 [Helianthus annuus]|nr:hypothetical protein HanIR_Chr03g0127051 [Helianthus annuus]KAJ0936190.1 hypothetical protein HanRHA438_Chr03g0127971 [Helianthus annuus]